MSSIYDALVKLQKKNNDVIPMPLLSEHKKTGKKIVFVVVPLVLIISTAAVFYYIYDKKQTKTVKKINPAPIVKAVPLNTAPAKSIVNQPSVEPLNPLDTEMLFSKADEMKRSGDTENAIELYNKALKILPERKDAYINLGSLYFEKKDYSKSITTYEEGLKYFKNDAALINNLGSVLLSKGSINDAITKFKQAKTISTDYVEPIYNLACAYAKKGDKKAAINTLKEAVVINAEVRKWAKDDPDLSVLKSDSGFKNLMTTQSDKGEK